MRLPRHKNKNRGSSTTEYIILFTAVISVFITFFNPAGAFNTSLKSTFNSVTNSMMDLSLRLKSSRNTPPEEEPVVGVSGIEEWHGGPIPP